MPIRKSEPSSSVASFDSGEASGEAQSAFDYGIPRKCYCGQFMEEVVSTTEENRGRRYYTCPAIEFEAGEHIEKKWLDEAIQEELTTYQTRIGQIEDRLDRNVVASKIEFIRRSTRELREEIEQLNKVVHKRCGEITRLKEFIRGSTPEIREEIEQVNKVVDKRDGEITRLNEFLKKW